jgi:hypothetical protein
MRSRIICRLPTSGAFMRMAGAAAQSEHACHLHERRQLPQLQLHRTDVHSVWQTKLILWLLANHVALGQLASTRGVLYGCNWQRQPARNVTESSLGECGQVASSCVET